jgi:hypothetical protein
MIVSGYKVGCLTASKLTNLSKFSVQYFHCFQVSISRVSSINCVTVTVTVTVTVIGMGMMV